jgi:hypothetical protein
MPTYSQLNSNSSTDFNPNMNIEWNANMYGLINVYMLGWQYNVFIITFTALHAMLGYNCATRLKNLRDTGKLGINALTVINGHICIYSGCRILYFLIDPYGSFRILIPTSVLIFRYICTPFLIGGCTFSALIWIEIFSLPKALKSIQIKVGLKRKLIIGLCVEWCINITIYIMIDYGVTMSIIIKFYLLYTIFWTTFISIVYTYVVLKIKTLLVSTANNSQSKTIQHRIKINTLICILLNISLCVYSCVHIYLLDNSAWTPQLAIGLESLYLILEWLFGVCTILSIPSSLNFIGINIDPTANPNTRRIVPTISCGRRTLNSLDKQLIQIGSPIAASMIKDGTCPIVSTSKAPPPESPDDNEINENVYEKRISLPLRAQNGSRLNINSKRRRRLTPPSTNINLSVPNHPNTAHQSTNIMSPSHHGSHLQCVQSVSHPNFQLSNVLSATNPARRSTSACPTSHTTYQSNDVGCHHNEEYCPDGGILTTNLTRRSNSIILGTHIGCQINNVTITDTLIHRSDAVIPIESQVNTVMSVDNLDCQLNIAIPVTCNECQGDNTGSINNDNSSNIVTPINHRISCTDSSNNDQCPLTIICIESMENQPKDIHLIPTVTYNTDGMTQCLSVPSQNDELSHIPT